MPSSATSNPAHLAPNVSTDAASERQTWAAYIASDPDRETFVFRTFPHLSALNLLNLQEEMSDLEAEIHQTHSSSALTRQRQELNSSLRLKIKEYREFLIKDEALILEHNVSALHRPGRRVLEALRQMFAQSPRVSDPPTDHYLDRETDLVALSTLPRQDYLSKYLRRGSAFSPQDTEKGGKLPAIGRFEERKIARTVTFLTVVIAAIFLIGPILALYFTPPDWERLLIIVVFTAGFAASIALITSAQRAEIFVATATYAAVLVVFVNEGGLSRTSAVTP
ncbi:DUF6594 domain-containing protein [Microdochium nivale]|nr:DUF6594 domain-containing protein [Microdochium nivale]